MAMQWRLRSFELKVFQKFTLFSEQATHILPEPLFEMPIILPGQVKFWKKNTTATIYACTTLVMPGLYNAMYIAN